MSVHKGHRERMRKRFLEEGLDHFSDIQALELALFYCIPRADTNPIAHALLERFGSLSQVLEAPVEELKKVHGMGEHSAVFLHIITEFGRYYMVSRTADMKILTTLEQCAEYMLPLFYGRRLETVFLLCLDAKCKVLSCREIAEGDVNSTGLSVRKVVETALGANATSVVLAHNHPSGVAVPSGEDVQTTCKIAAALEAVDVQLVDHIVVADQDYVSMVQSGIRFNDQRMI